LQQLLVLENPFKGVTTCDVENFTFCFFLEAATTLQTMGGGASKPSTGWQYGSGGHVLTLNKSVVIIAPSITVLPFLCIAVCKSAVSSFYRKLSRSASS